MKPIHTVNYVKGVGWELIINDLRPLKYCISCGEQIELPFHFCREFQQPMCKKCELGTNKRLCRSHEYQHEHFHIVSVKHNPDLGGK